MTLHQIGGSGLLLDAGRQQIFSLDPQAAWLWCCIEDGLDEAAVVDCFADDFAVPRDQAADAVEAIVGRLGALLHEARAVPHESGETVRRRLAGARPAEASTCRLVLLDTVFDVAFPSVALRERFRSAMGHLESEAPAADIEVAVVERDGGYTVVVDGEMVEEAESPLEVATQVKAALVHVAINRQPFDACLHASLVRQRGTTVLLPAESGSGKSCLSLTLAGAGFECLGDDLALFSLDGPTVRGVATASCVKSDAWEAMSEIHPALRSVPAHHRVDGKLVKYLPVARPEAQPGPVSLIVFPSFRIGLETRLTPLEPGEALRRLLSTVLAWRARLSPERLDALIAWIEKTPCYALAYGASRDAMEVFDLLLRQHAAETGS